MPAARLRNGVNWPTAAIGTRCVCVRCVWVGVRVCVRLSMCVLVCVCVCQREERALTAAVEVAREAHKRFEID